MICSESQYSEMEVKIEFLKDEYDTVSETLKKTIESRDTVSTNLAYISDQLAKEQSNSEVVAGELKDERVNHALTKKALKVANDELVAVNAKLKKTE